MHEPDSLVREIVRKNNTFLIKQFGNDNAALIGCFLGLTNKKIMTLQPASGRGIIVVLYIQPKQRSKTRLSASMTSLSCTRTSTRWPRW